MASDPDSSLDWIYGALLAAGVFLATPADPQTFAGPTFEQTQTAAIAAHTVQLAYAQCNYMAEVHAINVAFTQNFGHIINVPANAAEVAARSRATEWLAFSAHAVLRAPDLTPQDAAAAILDGCLDVLLEPAQ